jgi:hypothetical protein
MAVILPKNYTPILSLKQTEQAIKLVKDFLNGTSLQNFSYPGLLLPSLYPGVRVLMMT